MNDASNTSIDQLNENNNNNNIPIEFNQIVMVDNDDTMDEESMDMDITMPPIEIVTNNNNQMNYIPQFVANNNNFNDNNHNTRDEKIIGVDLG